jgi:hypothetical protein
VHDGETAPITSRNGGGGGGAVGRIRINTPTGAAEFSGVVSPSTADAFTEGVVSTL